MNTLCRLLSINIIFSITFFNNRNRNCYCQMKNERLEVYKRDIPLTYSTKVITHSIGSKAKLNSTQILLLCYTSTVVKRLHLDFLNNTSASLFIYECLSRCGGLVQIINIFFFFLIYKILSNKHSMSIINPWTPVDVGEWYHQW